MPEGPEVRVIAECLHNLLKNKNLNEICFDENSKYNKLGMKNLNDLELPKKILGVTAKGKLIIFILEDNIYLTNNIGFGRWLKKKDKHSNL